MKKIILNKIVQMTNELSQIYNEKNWANHFLLKTTVLSKIIRRSLQKYLQGKLKREGRLRIIMMISMQAKRWERSKMKWTYWSNFMNRRMSMIMMSWMIKKSSRNIHKSKIVFKKNLMILLNQVELEERFGEKAQNKVIIEENKTINKICNNKKNKNKIYHINNRSDKIKF